MIIWRDTWVRLNSGYWYEICRSFGVGKYYPASRREDLQDIEKMQPQAEFPEVAEMKILLKDMMNLEMKSETYLAKNLQAWIDNNGFRQEN